MSPNLAGPGACFDADPSAHQLRAFAALIFRRIASKTRKIGNSDNVDMFISLDKEHSTVIRQKLLETLVSEADKAVRNKISDAVAELARQYYESSASADVALVFPALRC